MSFKSSRENACGRKPAAPERDYIAVCARRSYPEHRHRVHCGLGVRGWGMGGYPGRAWRVGRPVCGDLRLVEQFKWKGFISYNRAMEEMSE